VGHSVDDCAYQGLPANAKHEDVAKTLQDVAKQTSKILNVEKLFHKVITELLCPRIEQKQRKNGKTRLDQTLSPPPTTLKHTDYLQIHQSSVLPLYAELNNNVYKLIGINKVNDTYCTAYIV